MSAQLTRMPQLSLSQDLSVSVSLVDTLREKYRGELTRSMEQHEERRASVRRLRSAGAESESSLTIAAENEL